MKLVTEKITIQELKEMSEKMFGSLVKAVVDVEKNIMVVDAELHSDEEGFLIDNGSLQQDLWGINIYPDLSEGDRIEFDSMINLRPKQGNRTRSVESSDVRDKILEICNKLIQS